MKKLFYIVAILLLAQSCSKKTNDPVYEEKLVDANTKHLNIENQLKNGFEDWGSLIDTMYFVKLETTENSLLSFMPSDIAFGKEHIYILDRQNNGSVFIFDKKGKFVKRIPTGNSPGEIPMASALCFNSHTDELIVMSHNTMKFSVNGDFIKEYDPIRCKKLMAAGNGFWCYQTDYQNFEDRLPTFLSLDNDFNILDKFVLNKKKYIAFNRSQCTYTINMDTILFARPYDHNIYQFPIANPTKASIRYILDFGNSELNTSEYDFDPSANCPRAQDGEYYFEGVFSETENYALFEIVEGRVHINTLYYDKKNGEFYNQQTIWDKSLISFGNHIGATDGYFVQWTDAGALLSRKDVILEHNSKFLSQKDIDIIKNANENDNPYLLFYKLKSKI